MRRIFGIAAAVAISVGTAGCGGSSDSTQPGSSESEGGDPTPVSSASDEKRFYGLESFTVVRRLEGMQSGTVTEHVRNWGNERVEIRDLEVGFGGFKQQTRERFITQGEWITQINLDQGTAVRSKNPMYAGMVKNVGTPQDAIALGKEMLKAMGATESGETGSYAGESCNIWNNASIGQTVCMSDDGITLFTGTNMGGVEITDTAVEFRRGDPGPDSAYEVPADIGVGEAPDIEKLMKGMKGMRPPGQ